MAMLRRCLQLVMGLALLGTLFSGVLTFREFVEPDAQACSPLGSPESIFGQPPCVYGLIMYGLIALVAGYGLLRVRQVDGPA